MKIIDHAAEKVEKIISFAVIVLFVVTLSSCVLQVVTRYVLNSSLRWTDELARYTFIYGNVLGAVLMQRIHGHATVTVLVNLFPAKLQKIVSIFVDLLIFVISSVLVYSGIQMVRRTTKQLSPGMGIPLSCIYASIVIGGCLFMFFTLVDLLHQWADSPHKNGMEGVD